MKLTAAEKERIQKSRDLDAKRKRALTLSRRVLEDLTDAQAMSIADQMAAAYKRLNGPRPRCTCDSQWTDPRCPAAAAGYRSKGGPCDEPPERVAVIRVPL